MDTYDKNLNACLLHRNKQLTRQLKDYQQTLALTDCSSSLMLAMGQLLRLHRLPSYGLVTSEEEWCHLFAVIDMFYGGCLSADLVSYQLNIRELKLCYPERSMLSDCIQVYSVPLFNIAPRSVLKAKQRIKIKLALSATDSLDIYIQNLSHS